MPRSFTFELVSPEKLLFSGQADMVVIPAEDGNIGVLAEHAPLITTLRPGVLRVYEGDRITQQVFLSGGFAEVTQTRCTVLADAAIAVGDIDQAKAQEDFLKLNNEAATASDGAHKQAMQAQLVIARAKVQAAST